MKTFVPFKNIFTVALAACVMNSVVAQSGPGGVSGSGNTNDVLNSGLNFSATPRIQSGTDKKVGAIYLVEDVTPGIDAKIRIDSLVNGAKVMQVDDNGNGVGYKPAFQPEIRTGNVTGKSYVVFTFTFFHANTNTTQNLQSLNVTALDIDGNATLKEFAEINVGGGGIAKFMSTSSDLSLLQIIGGRFMGQNVSGIERDGIDTASMRNMFTASNSNVSSFTIKYGATTTTRDEDDRQYSLYMKGFTYPNQMTLPVELTAFSATLNDSKKAVDLKWTTETEINVSHFSIEKSLDGQNYSEAGVMFAYGNTSSKMNYSFTDKNINASGKGVIYYRLRSVDIDGKSQLSPIRIIRIGKEESVTVLTYPNPVANELRVTIPASWQGKKVSYEVIANNGRVTIRTESTSSSQTETINASSLTQGFYVVRVICNGEVATQKIVKQ
jgi:hypothetical protein